MGESEIEDAIAAGEMNAAQVFTEMRTQLEQAERERDEARGLLRRNHSVLCWLTWLDPVVEDRDESEIKAKQKQAAQIMNENDAHLRDTGA